MHEVAVNRFMCAYKDENKKENVEFYFAYNKKKEFTY